MRKVLVSVMSTYQHSTLQSVAKRCGRFLLQLSDEAFRNTTKEGLCSFSFLLSFAAERLMPSRKMRKYSTYSPVDAKYDSVLFRLVFLRWLMLGVQRSEVGSCLLHVSSLLSKSWYPNAEISQKTAISDKAWKERAFGSAVRVRMMAGPECSAALKVIISRLTRQEGHLAKQCTCSIIYIYANFWIY